MKIPVAILLLLGVSTQAVYAWKLYVKNSTPYAAKVRVGRSMTVDLKAQIAPGTTQEFDMKEYLNEGIEVEDFPYKVERIDFTVPMGALRVSGQREYTRFVLAGPEIVNGSPEFSIKY